MSEIMHDDAWEGFGTAGDDDVRQLLKALEAQAGVTDIADLQSVGALQPQSMEGTLALLTHSDKHITLWKDLPQSPAASTLEEYSAQTGYGQEGGWVGQMESPLESDPQAKRKYAVIKFLRQMWKVSDVSGIVSSIRDSEVWAKQAATMRALRTANRTMYSGDSDMVSEAIDGFEKTILNSGSPDHVIDLRGGTPTQTNFRIASELIMANYGSADGAAVYCSQGGMTTLDTVLENTGTSSAQRFLQGTVGAGGEMSMGFGIKNIFTSFGTLRPKVDIFIAGEYESKTVPKRPSTSNPEVLVEGKTSVRAPDSPALSVATSASAAGSKWDDADAVRPSNKTYGYRVAAGNRWGLSAACAAGDAGAVVVAGGKNTLTITPANTSVYPATYYEIFSEQVEDDADYKFVRRVKDSGAATTTFDDLNADIPGTTRMFILDLTSAGEMRSFTMRRLAPLHAKQYARIGEYKWGTLSMYLTPIYYAPLRFVMIKNVAVNVHSKSNLLEI